MSDCLALFGVIRALPIRTGFGKVNKQLQLILSLSVWVPTGVHFVACFQSNCWFSGKIVAHQELFCVVTLLASSAQLQ